MQGQSVSQVEWLWTVSPAILSLIPKWACGKSDTAMRSLCTSSWFPVSYVFKYIGNNPSFEMRPSTWRWQRFNWKGRKICSHNTRCRKHKSSLNKWGKALWLDLWNAKQPGRTDRRMSNRPTQIMRLLQQNKSQEGLVLFCGLKL